MPNGDDSRLLDLLEEWERRVALGEQPLPEDLAGTDVGLAEELRAAIRDLEGAEWLDGAVPGDDSREESGLELSVASLTSTSRPLFGATESTRGGSDGAAKGSHRNGAFGAPGSPTEEKSPVAHRYEILEPHGKGGLGVVYRAVDQEFGREVALKSIQRIGPLDEIRRAKFRREAKITGCLEHPGIVPVYSLGEDDRGDPYYAMRFVQGENLKACIARFHGDRARERRPLDGAELRSLLRRFLAVCDAVGYAHDQGVVHRDLKPDNIMLGKHGETLVVDWGLAKRFREPEGAKPGSGSESLPPSAPDDSDDTKDGTLLGTRAYAPPEQLTGRLDDIGPASDVYSLGVVLYEILTGARPVESDSIVEHLARVEAGEHVPARGRLREVPAALEAICRKACAVEPRGRYATANLLKADVEAWLDDRPVLAKPDTLADRSLRWTRRHPALTAGAMIALVSLALAGSAAFWIDGRLRAAVAAAETEHYYNERAALADLLSERPAGWTDDAGKQIAKLREAPAARKPTERTSIASAAWSASLGRELAPQPWQLDELDYQPYRAVLSPDRKLLALPQSRAALWTWCACVIADSRTGEIVRRLTYTAPVLETVPSIFGRDKQPKQDGMRAAGFSDDNAWIAVGLRHGGLLVWQIGQTPDGSPMTFESGTSEPGGEIVWLKDGASFVASFGDELQLWRRDGESFSKTADATIPGRSSRLVREPETDRLFYVAEGKVQAVDGETLQATEVRRTKWTDLPPGSGFLAFHGDASMQVFDLADPAEPFTLFSYEAAGTDARIRPVSFDAGGSLAVAGVEAENQFSLQLFDVASGEVLSRRKVDSGNDVVPVFADDGTVLLIQPFGVSRWQVRGTAGHRTVAMSARPPLDADWASQEGSGLVSLPNRIVSLRVGPEAKPLESRGHTLEGEWRVRVSPSGDEAALLTTAEDSRCKLLRGEIDAATGELRVEGKAERLPECELAAWSPDGNSLWTYLGHDDSSSPGGHARIARFGWPGLDESGNWEGPVRENVERGKGQVQALAVNRFWTVGGYRSGRLFCLHAKDAKEAAGTRTVSDQRILALDAAASENEAFAGLEDGRLLAVRLPDLETTEIAMHENAVVSVDLSADGARLLSATARGRLAIRTRDGGNWRKALEIHLGKPIVEACWVDARGRTLCVRLENERGVRMLDVPQEIWESSVDDASVATATASR
ncbi:MAG TPA: serine/threonine-protein kinase [Pirellulaceae bacterium]|jgi:serine/threonine protein kinase|nr:serine/threonine-protein kinase [Pirellulaceae bacterium]